MRTLSVFCLGLVLVSGLTVLSSCSRQEPTLVEPPSVLPGKVAINEVYTRGSAGNRDWIEIYNGTSNQVDMSGYKIYGIDSQTGSKPKKALPPGTVLSPKAFYVVVADTNTSTSVADGFDLSSSGQTIWLEDAGASIIDSVAIPALGADTSWARRPDGSANFAKLSPTTRGTNNEPAVVMNEVFSRGSAGNLDWVEIYNPSSLPIDIGGYKIYDSGGQTGVKEKKTIPAGTIVPAKGFFVVVTDTNSSAAVSDGFGLSSAGEQVWLENATGTLIDTITFLAMDVTQSYGRYPDGEAAWAVLSQFTRGTANRQ